MDKPPKVLWHYTTFEILAKILGTECILATDHRFLNDSMEFKTGLERLEFWRNARADTTLDGAQNMELATHFKDGRIGAQVICFSSLKDDLSMWRGYGNVGNKNDGVAIGFKFEDLQSISENSLNKYSRFSKPQECVYDPNALQARLREEYGVSLEKATDSLKVEDFLRKSMPLEKSYHFKHEQEWRMFCPNSLSSIDMKQGMVTEVGGTFRKHFRLPYIQPDRGSGTMRFPMGISEIMAGPNTNHEKLEVFCSTAFRLNACDYPTISQSKIPFV